MQIYNLNSYRFHNTHGCTKLLHPKHSFLPTWASSLVDRPSNHTATSTDTALECSRTNLLPLDCICEFTPKTQVCLWRDTQADRHLYITGEHFNKFHHTTPNHAALHCTTLHHTALYTKPHCTSHHHTPHCSTPHHTTPHHTTPHHTTPHSSTPQHSTLHHTPVQDTTPHHTTPHHTVVPLH